MKKFSFVEFGLWRADAAQVQPCVCPDGMEIVEILLSGVIRFEDGKTYRRGTIFCHKSGEKTIYDSVSEEPYVALYLRMQNSTMRNTLKHIGVWHAHYSPEQFYHDLLLIKRHRMNQATIRKFIRGTLEWQMKISDDPETPPDLVRKVSIFCERFFGQQLTIEKLAQEFNMSRANIFRLFQKYFQQSPHKYLSELRLKNARDLLISNPKLSIKEVAAICGFPRVEVFYRKYRSFFHITPRETRP